MALQFLDGVLRRFGLMLFRSAQVRNQRHMDKQAVFPPDLQGDLPDRLNKRLRFDIADGSSDLGDDHICPGLFAHRINKILDLIGDMGDHLDR